MDLNNFFDTGKKKTMFKAVIREDKNILKFFVEAYDKKEAMVEAIKILKKDHPEKDSKKLSIEKF